MHILILASFYPSSVRPYTGIFFQEQAEALQRAEHRVGVIVLPRIRETLSIWRSFLPPSLTREDKNFPVYRMHRGWFPRVFPRICAWLTRFYGLPVFEQYTKAHGMPDIIHAHNVFYAGYLASEIKKKYHIPAVLTEHSSNHIRGRIFLPEQHRIAQQTFQQVDSALAVSHALKNVLSRYDSDFDVISNIVNTNFFTLSPMPQKTPFVIAAVGSLINIKNFPLLIHAFHQAFAGQSQVQLKIGGSGGDQNSLRQLINKLEMQSQIQLLGYLAREEVRNLFHESHVIVSSSQIETFGITLIEAMACGRPVIATRSGGPEDFVSEKTGLLVENNNIEALSQALKTMLNTYDQYDPKEIRYYCVERFSESAVVEQLLNRYQQIIAVSSAYIGQLL